MLEKYNSRIGYPDMLGRATSGYEMQKITATTTTTTTTTTAAAAAAAAAAAVAATTTTTTLLISATRISFKFLSVIHIYKKNIFSLSIN